MGIKCAGRQGVQGEAAAVAVDGEAFDVQRAGRRIQSAAHAADVDQVLAFLHHLQAVDADAVGQHFALDEIFLRARVDHFLQGIGNQFGIQLHIVVIFGQRYEEFSAFSQSNRLKRLITPRQGGSSPILRLAVWVELATFALPNQLRNQRMTDEQYLRKLIEEDAAAPRYIQTVWGVGYVFVPDGNN